MDLSFSTSASVHLFFLRIALLIQTGDGKNRQKLDKQNGRGDQQHQPYQPYERGHQHYGLTAIERDYSGGLSPGERSHSLSALLLRQVVRQVIGSG
jgi:hypothetical protein